MKYQHRIVFLGSGDYSLPVIDMLRGHGLELVLTTETQGKLIQFLKKENIPFASTHVTEEKSISKKELWQKVEDIHPTLGVLASFGAIIPQRVIDMFPHGIWNIHPSLLPKYKGPSPIQATILSGQTETGITIIRLDDQVDHGPILAQEKVTLSGNETLQDLKHSLFQKGGEMIEDLLQILENGEEITATPQDHSKESFTEKITRQHGFINIENPPEPEKINSMIRAYHPWPGVWMKWKMATGKERIVKLLPGGRIQVEGKKPMTYKEFINGYQKEGQVVLQQLGLV